MENYTNQLLEEQENEILVSEEQNLAESENSAIEPGDEKIESLLQESIAIESVPIDAEIIKLVAKHLQEACPELEPKNASELIVQALELFVAQNKICTKLSDENRKIGKLIAENPRIYLLLDNLLKGDPVSVALVKSDLMDVAPESGDDDYNSYSLAIAQTKERKRKAKELAKTRLDKCEQCNEVSSQFYKEISASDEEIVSFVSFLESIIDKLFTAEIDHDLLVTLWKAFSFDKEVKYANERGVVDGKNIMILQKRRLFSDGLAPASSVGSSKSVEPRKGYIERLLQNR